MSARPKYVPRKFAPIAKPDVETLGQLVGQMAHDLNNLIATAMIGIELAAQSKIDPQLRRLLDGVMHSIGQQQALTQAMGRAAHACERSKPLDLHKQIEAATSDMRAALGAIELELRLGAADARIQADARFLHAALIHLAGNACMSMPEGGRFLLITRNVKAFESLDPDREFVLLEAVDSGKGMSEETRMKAFNLFFSTHQHAYGLGLAQVRDMVRRAGGAARFEATPDQGAIVALAFPLAN